MLPFYCHYALEMIYVCRMCLVEILCKDVLPHISSQLRPVTSYCSLKLAEAVYTPWKASGGLFASGPALPACPHLLLLSLP